MQRGKDRDAFVKQGLGCTHARVGSEMALEGIVMKEICQRQKTHALVIRHVGPHDDPKTTFAA